MRSIILFSIIILLLNGCSEYSSSKIQLQFLHFWTEPSQQRLIDSLITEFEKLNPNISIEQIPVQWSEGRTKLLLVHSSGKPPDITHLGIEWAQEFIDQGIFSPIDLVDSIPKQCLDKITGRDGTLYCQPWTMNTRAMILTHDVSKITTDTATWDEIIYNLHQGQKLGLNSSEPHNVTKKYLPILWSSGSMLFQKLPFSSTCDEKMLIGLKLLRELKKYSRIEQSRKLDEYLVKGSIQIAMSGQWILPELKLIPHRVLPRIPGTSGLSILSGDCIGISKQSKNKKEAFLFLKFITQYARVKELCLALNDIGLPANERSFNDTDFYRNEDQSHFTKQCKNSIFLPSPSYFLDAEQILEDHIMRFVYDDINEYEMQRSLQLQLQELENKKGS